jgi:hypothetical protein
MTAIVNVARPITRRPYVKTAADWAADIFFASVESEDLSRVEWRMFQQFKRAAA